MNALCEQEGKVKEFLLKQAGSLSEKLMNRLGVVVTLACLTAAGF